MCPNRLAEGAAPSLLERCLPVLTPRSDDFSGHCEWEVPIFRWIKHWRQRRVRRQQVRLQRLRRLGPTNHLRLIRRSCLVVGPNPSTWDACLWKVLKSKVVGPFSKNPGTCCWRASPIPDPIESEKKRRAEQPVHPENSPAEQVPVYSFKLHKHLFCISLSGPRDASNSRNALSLPR